MLNINKEKGTVSLEISINDVRKQISECDVEAELSDKECMDVIKETLSSFQKGHDPVTVLGVNKMIGYYALNKVISNANKKPRLKHIVSRIKPKTI